MGSHLDSCRMRPNIALIVFDTARADALEPTGAPPGSTPAVSDLAARGGAAAPRATACWTLPSHASMFTGLLPRAAGLVDAPGGRARGAAAVLAGHRDRLLPEVLRRAGYATGAVSTNLWVSRASGFATGFERFESIVPPRQAHLHREDLRGRTRWSLECLRASVDDGAAGAERVLERWIGELDGTRPFFWFVNLVECHSPYLPPRPYNGLGPLERLRAGEDARRHLSFEGLLRTCLGGLELESSAVERMRHLYAGSIRYMDDWLARVLERLGERGVLDETLVIVTSDHGENLGEGGLITHALSLDERLIRVPMVAAGPGAERLLELESLVRLPRVLGEVAEVDPSPWAGDSITGDVAISQFEPPVRREDPRAAQTIERWGLGEAELERLTTPFSCATAGGLKLMRRAADELVYELANDPLELTPRSASDLPATRANELEALRAALDSAEAAVVAPRAAEGKPPTAAAEEVAELEDRMRLLGYM
jgi:arylsulfatase A-like enzyme